MAMGMTFFLNSQCHPDAAYFIGLLTGRKEKIRRPLKMDDPLVSTHNVLITKPQILQKNVSKNHIAGATQHDHFFLLQIDNKP